jgi:ribosomal protein S18 acetylase RimI-like enzyme
LIFTELDPEDPQITELIAPAIGNPTAERTASVLNRFKTKADWTLYGYTENGVPVACVGVERTAPDEIAIHTLAVAAERRRNGVGRALLDDVVARTGAKAVVAETDSDAVGFYERCGFNVRNTVAKFGNERLVCRRLAS